LPDWIPDYFVLLNFEGFREIIDQLGGIEVNVPQAVDDPFFPTDDYGTIRVRFEPGPQLMDGDRALTYARTRHADSDFGRTQRQQQVLMAIFDRIRERGLLEQLTNIDEYTSALRDSIRTDIPKPVLLDLGLWGREIQADDVQRLAIDAKMIVALNPPATFAAQPQALKRLVGQLIGEPVAQTKRDER
ncbi:MAG: LCP family protein, partial [Chloroflexaceae bacterium]|nr:LCP family protein [Chloroflexaceae bacterium]